MSLNTKELNEERSVEALTWPDAVNDDYDLYVQIKENLGSQLDTGDEEDHDNQLKDTDVESKRSIEIVFENANQDSNLDELEKILTNWLEETDVTDLGPRKTVLPEKSTPQEHVNTVKPKAKYDKCRKQKERTAVAVEKPKEPVVHVYNRKELEELVANSNVSPKERIYKCQECPFETKHANCLAEHTLRHKDPSELKSFKCTQCKYEAKFQRYLKEHMLTHKTVPDENMFRCLHCKYKAKSKGLLKKHIVHHRKPSEIKMQKCKFCNYQTRFNANLNRHLLNHKDKSQIKMHKCPLCKYEGKTSTNLKQHIFTHKKKGKSKMYKCDICKYETKLKKDLSHHISRHDIKKQKMRKCYICNFESKTYKSFQIHLLTHKECSELKTYWSNTEL